MTIAKWRIICAILALLLIGALGTLLYFGQIIREAEERPAFRPSHAAMIERAYRLEALRNRLPVETIKEQDYPIVVSFSDRGCVQLTPPLTWVGGHSIYCFRHSDGALIEQQRVGE